MLGLGRKTKSEDVRGTFLIEAVAGVLILVTTMLTMTILFQSSTNYFNKTQRASEASQLAREIGFEMRTLAQDPVEFSSGLPTFASSVRQRDGFTVETEVIPHTLYSPSTSLELAHGPQARSLNSSALLATVRVSWTGSSPETEPTYTTLIGDPLRDVAAVVLTNAPSSYSGPVTIQAHLEDVDSNAIPDVSFAWTVHPLTTRASLSLGSRYGDEMTLNKEFRDLQGAIVPGRTGQIELHLKALYAGASWEFDHPVNIP